MGTEKRNRRRVRSARNRNMNCFDFLTFPVKEFGTRPIQLVWSPFPYFPDHKHPPHVYKTNKDCLVWPCVFWWSRANQRVPLMGEVPPTSAEMAWELGATRWAAPFGGTWLRLWTTGWIADFCWFGRSDSKMFDGFSTYILLCCILFSWCSVLPLFSQEPKKTETR